MKKRNEVKIKASHIKEKKNKVDALKVYALKAGGLTCHECTSCGEFETGKENIVDEKEK